MDSSPLPDSYNSLLKGELLVLHEIDENHGSRPADTLVTVDENFAYNTHEQIVVTLMLFHIIYYSVYVYSIFTNTASVDQHKTIPLYN